MCTQIKSHRVWSPPPPQKKGSTSSIFSFVFVHCSVDSLLPIKSVFFCCFWNMFLFHTFFSIEYMIFKPWNQSMGHIQIAHFTITTRLSVLYIFFFRFICSKLLHIFQCHSFHWCFSFSFFLQYVESRVFANMYRYRYQKLKFPLYKISVEFFIF